MTVSQIEGYKKALVSIGFKYKGKKEVGFNRVKYTYIKDGTEVEILTIRGKNGKYAVDVTTS